MEFLGHNFSSAHARKSIKGSIDAAYRQVSNKIWATKWHIGLASRARQSG